MTCICSGEPELPLEDEYRILLGVQIHSMEADLRFLKNAIEKLKHRDTTDETIGKRTYSVSTLSVKYCQECGHVYISDKCRSC